MKRRLMFVAGLLLIAGIAFAVACGSDDDDDGSDATRSPAEATSIAATVEAGGEAPTDGAGDGTSVQESTLSLPERQTEVATEIQGDKTDEANEEATEDAQDALEEAENATREAERANTQTAEALEPSTPEQGE